MEKAVGRPKVITPEVLSKLREAFLMGCTDTEACLFANIGRTTLFEYEKANPDFRTEKEEWKDNPTLVARKTVYEALPTDKQTAQWYLERKVKKEFSQRVENTGADGKDLPTPILAIANVSTNNGDKQNSEDVQKDSGDTRGDISEQDNINPALPDSIIPIGQEAQTDEHSVGIDAPPEKGSDERLPDNPEGT